MRVTIKGLRRWILGAAALLIVVVAGFLTYGRNRFRHIEKDLPARLGINIQQTANGFSYSHSSQGHTDFTLKAAKQVQMRSGHVLLHGVDITLYGPPGSGRADHIFGSDFDYDQKHEVATSQGEVQIELQGMGSAARDGSASQQAGQSNTIHVRTQGLTFMQKSGEATTTQPVEFQLAKAAGSSVGANYNSKTGVLVLDSQVKITTSSNGRPAVVQAAHATLLRASLQAFLVQATVQYETENAKADQATIFFRKDGTTEKVDAQGHVQVRTDTGASVDSATAQILMNAKSQPAQADLGGGVVFSSVRNNESMHGAAAEATLLFATAPVGRQNSQTVLRHAEFRRNVDFSQDLTGLAKDPRGRAEKQLQGQTVDVDFAPGERGQVEARKATAEGSPVLTMRQMPSKGAQQTTRISGDHLVATLGAGNALRQLDGNGNTRILDESSDGARDVSQGDELRTTFVQQAAAVQPRPAGSGSRGRTAAGGESVPKMETTLETAVQDGHVVLMEIPARKPGATAERATLKGWAGHAEYHAADQVLHLSQSPRITDSQTMQMSADLIDYHRDTQDAGASGSVKATYTQPPAAGAGKSESAPPAMGGSGPVHVIADRAAMHHASSQTLFYGTVRRPARMWQDADSLLAPVIEIDQKQNVLKAGGEGTGTEPVVDANFTTAMGAKHEQTLVRVRSQTLVYSDKDRQADFHGAVTAQDADGTIRADDAIVYLKPAAAKTAGASTAQAAPGASAAAKAARPEEKSREGATGSNSQVDRILAQGHVMFSQPGRRGEGEKLLYTGENGKYVLTGTAAEPPTIWDRAHGTTTGAALIFNSQDDSVEVSGGKASAVTETHAPK